MMMITPTQHEKNEWSRLAQDAYARDYNSIGHEFSGLASLRSDDSLSLARFDRAQSEYRVWLVYGFDSLVLAIARRTFLGTEAI